MSRRAAVPTANADAFAPLVACLHIRAQKNAFENAHIEKELKITHCAFIKHINSLVTNIYLVHLTV